MANIISKGTNFTEGDTVTATNLNNHVDNASFVTGTGNTTDNSTLEVHTDGYLKVKDGGIQSSHLADDAISGSDTVVINNNNFTDNTINASKIVDGTISASKLDSGVLASLAGSMETDGYDGVKKQSSGIAFDPATIKIFTTKVARIRTVCFELNFGVGGEFPLLSVPTDSSSITFLFEPPTGKSFNAFDLGTTTTALDGNHYPYGSLRYETYDTSSYSKSTQRTDGWVSFEGGSDGECIYILLAEEMAGKYLQTIRGSVTFPTAS